MVFSTTAGQSQAPVQKYIKNSCVEVAREWFKWDDDVATQRDEDWAKFFAQCPEFTTPPTLTRHNVVELSEPTSLSHYLGESKYDASYIPGNMSEAEAVAQVEELPFESIVRNRSAQSMKELIGNLVSLMPDTQVFAGYHKERMAPKNVEQAIYCRYIGVRSRKVGFNNDTHKYIRDNSQLVKLGVLDIDCQRPQFIQRHGQLNTAAEIFDELPDNYKPLLTVTNERSHNCHAAFQIAHSPEEEADPIGTNLKLKEALYDLADAIGADPGYNGYTMRGPLFVPGMHKNQKPSKTRGIFRRDPDTDKVVPDSTFPHIRLVRAACIHNCCTPRILELFAQNKGR